jgi:hypothetical protein
LAGILKIITEGVPKPKQYRSPMPPMGGAQLSDTQASAVAAYVWGLSHKTASSTKAPAELLIPGEKIFPESLTSTTDGRVIIGTITGRTIFVVKPGSSNAEAWISPNDETALGVYGVFADEKSQTLWACFSSFPGKKDKPQAPSNDRLTARYPCICSLSDERVDDEGVWSDGPLWNKFWSPIRHARDGVFPRGRGSSVPREYGE